jgi:hypothetical protein
MKKLLIVIIVLIAVTANAQTGRGFGFKAGVNFSNPMYTLDSKDANVNLTGGMGFMAGAFVDLINVKGLTLSSELYFNRKIGKGEIGFPGIYMNQTIYTSADARIDYLVFGIMGKFNMDFEKITPFIILEPRVNFYINDKVTVSNNVYFDENFVSDQIRKIGFGVNLGLGMDFIKTKNNRTFFEILYCPDFFNTYEDGLGKVKSNAIEIRLGTTFL